MDCLVYGGVGEDSVKDKQWINFKDGYKTMDLSYMETESLCILLNSLIKEFTIYLFDPWLIEYFSCGIEVKACTIHPIDHVVFKNNDFDLFRF